MQKITKKYFISTLFGAILILFALNANAEELYLAQGIGPTVENELGRDIIGLDDNSDEDSLLRDKKVIVEENKNDLITFSARNISVKDAFATLARISGQSISVGSDIRDDDKIAVIEIKEQPFEQAFFSLIDASMVNYTQSGQSYTVIKGSSQRQIMIFELGAAGIDKELPVLERRTDLSYDNQDLATLLKDLANKYGIDIVLTAVPTERVSARVRDVNIEEALSLVLSGTSFDFTKSGLNSETYVIYNRLNKNFTVGQTSKLFQLMNLEAKDVQALLPVQIRANVRISNDQNAIIADGSVNDLTRLAEFLKEIDRPLPQVELEVKLIEISKRAMVDFNAFANQLTVGFAPDVAMFNTLNSDGSVGVQNVLGSGLRLNLSTDKWKIFNDKITYLESMSLARVRAYPKLVSLSGRTAMINIDTDTNIVLGATSSQSSGLAVASTQSLQRITAGTALSITPVVGTGGLISTMIQIEVSDNSGKTNPAESNGLSIPATTTRRRIAAEVQVRDGETVSIGGLIVDNDGIVNSGLPLISNIPFIGGHLNNRNRIKDQSELIVLITPKIRNIPEDNTIVKTSTDKDVNPPIPEG